MILAERGGAEVGHLWILVHAPADAVADEVLDHGEAVIADVPGHLRGHVAPAVPTGHQLDRQLQHPGRAIEQPLHVGLDLAHRVRDRGIAAPAPEAAARVDAHHVAGPQLPRPRNPVHHLIVHRDAADGWKGHLARHALEQRHRPMLDKELLDRGVDLTRRHPGTNHRLGDLMSAPDHQAGPAHERDFPRRPKIDHDAHTSRPTRRTTLPQVRSIPPAPRRATAITACGPPARNASPRP